MDTSNLELERFLRAQELDYPRALAELRAGRKHSHWIWYVLPQLRGLGRRAMMYSYGRPAGRLMPCRCNWLPIRVLA
jgi:uncharacterized protein (DUF1810 family)